MKLFFKHEQIADDPPLRPPCRPPGPLRPPHPFFFLSIITSHSLLSHVTEYVEVLPTAVAQQGNSKDTGLVPESGSEACYECHSRLSFLAWNAG